MEIKEVDWGVANNFGDYIEVNRHLKYYPKLYEPIIEHELKHTDKFISMQDFRNDINQSNSINNWLMLKFMFKHPKSLTQLLPIYFTRSKGFVYDVNLSLVYVVMFIIFVFIFILGATI